MCSLASIPLRGSRWHAFHIHYHDDSDRVLLDVVRPAARKLLARGAIDSFFFIRYGLGGPHVRFRLRVRRGWEERVAAQVEEEARRLFELRPSLRQIEPETLARASLAFPAAEQAAGEAEIQPDNSLRRAPFEPEVERYGGTRYLSASLGLFALSSAGVLGALGRAAGGEGRGRRLGAAAEILLRQALCFARDGAELARLLAYGLEQQDEYPKAAERGAEAWGRQREALTALAAGEIERRLALPPPAPSGALERAEDPLATGSLLLSRVLENLAPAPRARVGRSQLHMTANRLGLLNSEEVYLSALLGAAFAHFRELHPQVARDLDAALGRTGGERVPVRALSAGLGSILLRRLEGAGEVP